MTRTLFIMNTSVIELLYVNHLKPVVTAVS